MSTISMRLGDLLGGLHGAYVVNAWHVICRQGDRIKIGLMMRHHGVPPIETVAEYGLIWLLEWIDMNTRSAHWKNGYIGAIRVGNIEVLDWLYARGYAWPRSCLLKEAGLFSTMDWLHAHGYRGRSHGYLRKYCNDRRMQDWLTAHGYP